MSSPAVGVGESDAAEAAVSAVVAGRRRIIVLRHGETTHNAAGIWQGQLDSQLSERGLAQARAAGPALIALGPSRIVSSDLGRAAVTARLVAEAGGIPLSLEPRFREIHAGQWQGLGSAEVASRFPEEYAAVRRGEDVRRGGDGESMGEVLVRVGAALADVVGSMAPGECVIVSTHGAAARAVVASLLGLDMALAWRILGGFGNCHWAELEEGRHGWRLLTWNVSAGVVASIAGPPPP
ncbi:MAG TPA: histidine phosphatase family protein [Phycicoccus sp.]|nr:histidine phosphatase family protein [Phycicoccus sp.]